MLRDSRLRNNLLPTNRLQSSTKVLEPRRIRLEKVAVYGITFQHRLTNSFEQRHVTIDSHLQKQISQLSSRTKQSQYLLRMLEACHPDFRQRIDVHQLAPVSLRALQRRQHPRMIGAGILPNDKDRFRAIEVFERDCSLPDSDRLAQRSATRFVTHVRTIRQVIRAKLPHEQLI